MKIEKRKVSGAIAATLGITASFALSACDDSSPTSGDVVDSVPGSADSQGPASSADANVPTSDASVTSSETLTPSSSSQAVDIPLSNEPVSSSVQEALSSLMESSSSEAAPASSVTVPESSSEALPASSATTPSSSSSNGWNNWPLDPTSSSNDYSDVCPDDDPWCIQVHMCEDRPGGCMAASMVTTFERDDITG